MDHDGVTEAFALHADCIPVRGAKNSAIYDLGRGRIVTFPTPFFEVLHSMEGRYTRSDWAADTAAEGGDATRIAEFVRYLIANELGAFGHDAGRFPEIPRGFERPGRIQNAIVDVDQRIPDFERVLGQLDGLGCEFVQIRAYSTRLGPDDVDFLARAARHKSIRSLELLVGYHEGFDDSTLSRIVREHLLIVRLVLHGAPADRILEVRFGAGNDDGIFEIRRVFLIRERIASSDRCGRIVPAAIQPPSVPLFHELLAFNGCLNGKISIDAEGNIKNCPSFGVSFGNVASRALADVVRDPGFRRPWQISKDEIEVCRDCEFRYGCTDCRAFLVRPGDLYSKPAKCGYDPYSGTWSRPAVAADGGLLHISGTAP